MGENQGMLQQVITGVLRKLIKTEYHHMELPANVYSVVTKRVDCGGYYEYNLKILDNNRGIDERFPEIPRVKCEDKYEVETTLVVLLMNGELDVYIIGSVIE